VTLLEVVAERKGKWRWERRWISSSTTSHHHLKYLCFTLFDHWSRSLWTVSVMVITERIMRRWLIVVDLWWDRFASPLGRPNVLYHLS
jgi:hypothetical protein